MQDFQLLYPLSYLLIVLGLVFAVVPILPGSLLIWLGVFAWANANSFKGIGWPTLVLLAVLVVIIEGSELLLTTAISRRSGASKKAILGAIIGSILGGLFFTGVIPIPVVGTILGGIAGAVIGILLVEFLTRRNLGVALKSAGGYILGYLASSALRLTLCLLMIAIFLLQAFVF